MLLFQKRFHEGLTSGRVTLTFRRWARPHVKAGGRYRCHPIGVLEVDAITRVAVCDITAADALATGFDALEELLAYMQGASEEPLEPSTEVFRVELHHGADGDRVSIALDDALTGDDVALLQKKLAKLDAKTPWTRATLAAIEAAPRVAASKLAVTLGREKLELKEDIRKLKKLGLTQSFEVGYEISPRGRAFLAATRKVAPRKSAPREPAPRVVSAAPRRAPRPAPTSGDTPPPSGTGARARRR